MTTHKHYILGLAGHIDHGKSALVKALTGVDPDRLPEEQARGMTIDLGFAHLEIDSRQVADTCYQIGIVDVPGHAGFINNMVTGIGSIDVAVLTVAVDDGWMPQSEEHLQILDYLGIKHAVVALTKVDLVKEVQGVSDTIRQRLARSSFADAPIVPTSVTSGRGLDELQITLAGMFDKVSTPSDIGKPRLPVDRVFTMQGMGTIVTGTLTGGTLHRGQAVVCQPTGQSTRIRSIQSHNQDLESIGPGRRAALNLADLPVAAKGRAGVSRGDVITLAELGEPTDTIHVNIWRTARESAMSSPPKLLSLKHASQIRWHHGGAHVAGNIHFIDREQLEAGEAAIAQIRLERPLFVFAGDRFLVRNGSKSATLAGGVVLETHAKRRGYRSAQQKASLNERCEAQGDVQKSILAVSSRVKAILYQQILLQSHYSFSQINAAMQELTTSGKVIEAGDFAIHLPWWNELTCQAIGLINAEHAQNPQHRGLELSMLRSHLEGKLFSNAALFDELVGRLCQQDIVQIGNLICRKSHAPELPPHLASAGAKIRNMLEASPFKPPARKEITKDKALNEALRFLIQQGEVLEVSANLVLKRESYEQASEMVRQYLVENGTASISQLRELLGTNRKVIVPLVEHFDRQGLTRRQGDTRVLCKPP